MGIGTLLHALVGRQPLTMRYGLALYGSGEIQPTRVRRYGVKEVNKKTSDERGRMQTSKHDGRKCIRGGGGSDIPSCLKEALAPTWASLDETSDTARAWPRFALDETMHQMG